MAESKMVSFRLNEDDAAAVAAVAGDEGLGAFAKRMTLECAAGERIKVVRPATMSASTARHAARPGIRHAAICPTCNTREFVASELAARAWLCPEHGLGEVQENNSYFAQSTA